MKFFSTIRTQRNTAFVVLLGWLFALASGLANACLLETPEVHSNAARAAAPKTSHAPAELVGHAQATAGHDDDSDTSKESCLKACDDGTRTLPNAQSGLDQTDPGPPALVATLWTASTRVASVSSRRDDLPMHLVGPPFRVRYSRLAL